MIPRVVELTIKIPRMVPAFHFLRFCSQGKFSAYEIAHYNLHFVKDISNEDKVKLAALHDQANIGPNNTDPPTQKKKKHAWAKEKAEKFETEMLYWKAWKALGNLSKDEAAKQYTEYGQRILKNNGIQTDNSVV